MSGRKVASSRRRRRTDHVSFGLRGRSAGVGAAPGTLTPIAGAPPGRVRVMAFDAATLVEKEDVSLTELRELRSAGLVLWVDVVGLGDAELVGELGAIFGLHPLALEDVLHLHQRSKVEPYPSGYFMAIRMATIDAAGMLGIEQVSLFLGDTFVVTFQEREGDCLEPVRQRMRHGRGRVRKSPPDYLAYALLDTIIDGYFPVLEKYGERLDALEESALGPDAPSLAERIHQVKRDLIGLRRAAWPLREAINTLMREEHPVVAEETRIYLRDCYDHCIQVVDLLETYRELSSGLMDLHLTTVSNRMNEVMKVLTMIATIFIPLSFIAGVYGMNFDSERSPLNMPELAWYFGYPSVLAVMLLVTVAMLVYFRRKRWL